MTLITFNKTKYHFTLLRVEVVLQHTHSVATNKKENS
jgi:hypothetical protein